MDRSEIFDIAHRRHPIAAPVSRPSLRELVSWLEPPAGGRAVDLGCGEGEWLQELLLAQPGMTGVGVDHMMPSTAAQRSEQRQLTDRVSWVETDASTWQDGLFDVVVCVGASHAFGGLDEMLTAVSKHLRAGGQAIVGDSIWEGEPSPAVLAALEVSADAYPQLAGLVETMQRHGLEPSFIHTSTVTEWDDYEFSWSGSVVDWALREAPTAQDREQALGAARDHRRDYLQAWRNQFGFATAVLHDGSA
jgi:ubiquinone/menaquinone biosynthesis C-methylase UbiE